VAVAGDLVINLDPSFSTAPTATADKVELLRWPADAARREELAAAHLPRLLSEGEGAVLRPLLDRFGQLVRWDEIIGTLWPDGGGTVKLAVARVSRLRVRLAPAGLAIHNIRGRGVVLDHGVPSTDATPTSPREAIGGQPEEDMWPIW
jgi:DNA-binding winged helix-turn-helix (wHTH) protein